MFFSQNSKVIAYNIENKRHCTEKHGTRAKLTEMAYKKSDHCYIDSVLRLQLPKTSTKNADT